ncbi:hypothetical protein BMS3Bbin04_00033 [bacterium BMS3Bbin04]|nr:hypothetical protein BMS3Bbin04_00033 [bacterium BMS3Bbin04]
MVLHHHGLFNIGFRIAGFENHFGIDRMFTDDHFLIRCHFIYRLIPKLFERHFTDIMYYCCRSQYFHFAVIITKLAADKDGDNRSINGVFIVLPISGLHLQAAEHHCLTFNDILKNLTDDLFDGGHIHNFLQLSIVFKLFLDVFRSKFLESEILLHSSEGIRHLLIGNLTNCTADNLFWINILR